MSLTLHNIPAFGKQASFGCGDCRNGVIVVAYRDPQVINTLEGLPMDNITLVSLPPKKSFSRVMVVAGSLKKMLTGEQSVILKDFGLLKALVHQDNDEIGRIGEGIAKKMTHLASTAEALKNLPILKHIEFPQVCNRFI